MAIIIMVFLPIFVPIILSKEIPGRKNATQTPMFVIFVGRACKLCPELYSKRKTTKPAPQGLRHCASKGLWTVAWYPSVPNRKHQACQITNPGHHKFPQRKIMGSRSKHLAALTPNNSYWETNMQQGDNYLSQHPGNPAELGLPFKVIRQASKQDRQKASQPAATKPTNKLHSRGGNQNVEGDPPTFG